MSQPLKVVAIHTARPALSAALGSVLARKPMLKIRTFESGLALATYMRLRPVHLLICDFDCAEDRADKLVWRLRTDPGLAHYRFQAMALSRWPDAALEARARQSRIDEILRRPVPPDRLMARSMARLLRVPVTPAASFSPARPPPAHTDYSAFGDNIVPLFD